MTPLFPENKKPIHVKRRIAEVYEGCYFIPTITEEQMNRVIGGLNLEVEFGGPYGETIYITLTV